MIQHSELKDKALVTLVRAKKICFGGNARLKIYGTLDCRSGKRMKRDNRDFFSSEAEAVTAGYRPCGHCMRTDYLKWKHGPVHS